jgi:hypothetical protein
MPKMNPFPLVEAGSSGYPQPVAERSQTPRGINLNHSLSLLGKTRYAVKEALDISYGAATHRLDAWRKAGGATREKMPIDSEIVGTSCLT